MRPRSRVTTLLLLAAALTLPSLAGAAEAPPAPAPADLELQLGLGPEMSPAGAPVEVSFAEALEPTPLACATGCKTNLQCTQWCGDAAKCRPNPPYPSSCIYL
jgi:hypothetical protein